MRLRLRFSAVPQYGPQTCYVLQFLVLVQLQYDEAKLNESTISKIKYFKKRFKEIRGGISNEI